MHFDKMYFIAYW